MINLLNFLKPKSLEREFTYYAFKHKYRILKNKMAEYYKTVEKDEVNLSGVYYKTPEQRAQNEILRLIKTDINKFNSLYEKAYSEL